ncbi:MAG: ATP-dependent metallopeptidase FtsH/Yme1/Tma family protein, partial [Hyphomicrobiales bacterium]
MNAHFRNFALWVIIALLLIALFQLFQSPTQNSATDDIAFSEFMNRVDAGDVRSVTIQEQKISGNSSSGPFQTYAPDGAQYVDELRNKGVMINARPPSESSPLLGALFSWLPMLIILGIWIFVMRQMQGSGGKAMGFGKSKAKLLTEAHGRVTFEDVAGIDEAKEDLQEIVEFL